MFFLLLLSLPDRPFFVNLHFSSHEDAWIAFQEISEAAKQIRFINPTWIRTQYFWKMTNKSRLLLINQIGNYELLKKAQRDSPILQMDKEEKEEDGKEDVNSLSSVDAVEEMEEDELGNDNDNDIDDQQQLLSKRRLITELDLEELDEQQQQQSSSQLRTFQTK
jgi:hypothetical protein